MKICNLKILVSKLCFIIPAFSYFLVAVIQGGWIHDITNGAVSGGESIYGPTFDGKHKLLYSSL